MLYRGEPALKEARTGDRHPRPSKLVCFTTVKHRYPSRFFALFVKIAPYGRLRSAAATGCSLTPPPLAGTESYLLLTPQATLRSRIISTHPGGGSR
ncbi:hypothetical protein NIES4075_70730 [Tolypothrix sp. NIES-4075]|uniref:hypothetical protein n=1 Tax=Tolypothrix sp. NIES-4075 TaxID=2005459 RepID=UPI000B5D01FE|nr:hypothetical protein [Tolypothrix sp. NIES-4075]GAX46052.1 hypothetical protein NIES4075_70730 [Tolypothrix sp. NIES-4075]